MAQASTSACLYASAFDFNAQDVYRIQGNQCLGLSPFPIDISTYNGNPNSGVAAIWDIDENVLGAGVINHVYMSAANEYYLVGRRNLKTNGTYY